MIPLVQDSVIDLRTNGSHMAEELARVRRRSAELQMKLEQVSWSLVQIMLLCITNSPCPFVRHFQRVIAFLSFCFDRLKKSFPHSAAFHLVTTSEVNSSICFR